MELGVHAGEWSALPPAERDCPLTKGSNTTPPPTHTRTSHTAAPGCLPPPQILLAVTFNIFIRPEREIQLSVVAGEGLSKTPPSLNEPPRLHDRQFRRRGYGQPQLRHDGSLPHLCKHEVSFRKPLQMVPNRQPMPRLRIGRKCVSLIQEHRGSEPMPSTQHTDDQFQPNHCRLHD
jgi:hypothetical protein